MSDKPLPSTGFMASLSEPEREELARFGRVTAFSKGECPVSQGDAHDSLFLLVGGKMRVVRDNPGGEALLAVLRPGDIFGELNILDRQPASATVRALGDCEVWQLDRARFEAFLEDNPTTGQRLLLHLARLLARRLRLTDAKVNASPERILDGWW